MKLATSIDEVITILDGIIASEVAANSNLAFFPVLYKKVTQRIQQGIQNNEFDDNLRMERLDVIFANRYIAAYYQLKTHDALSKSWEIAFSAGSNKKLLIMQHLLLGINAHINLDLGIAVAKTVGAGGDIADFEGDFNGINEILSNMVNDVQDRIGKVSPLFYLLEKVGNGKEDKVVSFSINLARDGAWIFANQYHFSRDKELAVVDRDQLIGILATKLTATKSRILRWTIKSIRWLETKDVSTVVEILRS